MKRSPFALARSVALLLPLLSACGTESGPLVVEAASPVRLVLDRATAELELRDTLTLEATAYDASGAAMSGAAVTWSSSDESVAEVSTTGLVTAVGGGEARITASAGTASASADLTVQAWNVADNAVVVDSTVLRLAGDSTERAGGTYRFTATGTPPGLQVGDVIVGAQNGGFLRRVTAVSIAGAEVILQTEPAALSDIIEEGSFETVIDDLLFAPADAPAGRALRPGEVRWGAAEFHPALPGVALGPSGVITLGGLDICAELKKIGGGSCPSGISKLQVVTGTVDFDPDLDLKASFSGLSLQSFRGVAKGSLNVDFDILLEAKTSATVISPQIKIAGITRPFYAQIGPVPILGYVELALNGGVEAKATAKGHIQAGYTSSHDIEVGAEWKDASGWDEIFQNRRTFDAREPDIEDGTLSGQIDVTTRIFLKPEIKIIFYGVVGPFLNVEPYGRFTMTFGTSSCGMMSEAGIDSEIGFTIPFLDPKIGNYSKKNSPWFSWPGRSWTCPLGTLDVSTVTNGSSPDPDGYSVVVDTLDKGHIGADDHKVVDFVEVGDRTVSLDGVASNCSVKGSNPVSVKVGTGIVTPISFQIECADPGGDLVVHMKTTGRALDPDGYTLSVDKTQTHKVDINGSATFGGLATGTHQLAVLGVAANCLLVGSNPRDVSVPSGGKTSVTIAVDCTASKLIAKTSTSGPPASSPWSITLDGSDKRSIEPNDQVTFEVADGPHSLLLSDLADNCTVLGANPRTATLGGGSITETFDVSCEAGGITVTVTTTGDAEPATSFTVAADTVTKTVGINGTATFSSLPAGSTTVELRDLPSHCLVQDENPRQVDVPGSTTFEVLCDAPVDCVYPNPEFLFLRDSILEEWDTAQAKPTFIDTVAKKDYGWLDVSASVETEPLAGGGSEVMAEWLDALKIIPVDASRAGEAITLSFRVTGALQRQLDPAEFFPSWAKVSVASWGLQLVDASLPNVTIDEIATTSGPLGSWFEFYGSAHVLAQSQDGHLQSARALIKVGEFLSVTDKDGLDVPVSQICSGSGTVYPR